RLVLGAMLEAWLDAELVERAAEERHLDAQAHQPDLAEGLQPQLVEGRAQVIRAGARAELAEAVGIAEGELALGSEGADGVTQLLDLRGADLALAEACHQPFDARIVAGALQRVEHVAEIALLAQEDALDTAVGRRLGQRLSEIEHEDIRLRQLLLARGANEQRDKEKDHQAEEEQADQR